MLKQSDLIQRHWDFTNAAVLFIQAQRAFVKKTRDEYDSWKSEAALGKIKTISKLCLNFIDEQNKLLGQINTFIGRIRTQALKLKRQRCNLKKNHWRLFLPSFCYLINSQKIYYIASDALDEMEGFALKVRSFSGNMFNLKYNTVKSKKKFETIERVLNKDPEFRNYTTEELEECKRKLSRMLMNGRAPGLNFC